MSDADDDVWVLSKLRCLSCKTEIEVGVDLWRTAAEHLGSCSGKNPYRAIPAWSYWWTQGYEVAWRSEGGVTNIVPDRIFGSDPKRWYAFSRRTEEAIVREAFGLDEDALEE